jgi:hypothetical protein
MTFTNTQTVSQVAPRTFYFMLTFWGKEFRDFVCDFTIPSLLSAGNIPSLRSPKNAKFLIATTAEDWAALSLNKSFRRLQELVSVEFLPNEDTIPPMHKYVRMSRGHALLAESCFRDHAIGINIASDSVFPDGCILEAQRLAIDEQKDVVLCAAIRFEMEGVLNDLRSQGRFGSDGVLTVPMREAVAVGLRNLHSESKASDWGAANFGRLHPNHSRSYFLTCCFWRIPKEDGLFIVTHNWAPFVVNYAVLEQHDTSTLDGRAIDGEYIFNNFPQYTKAIHVVDDSDSIFLLGLTPKAEMVPPQKAMWWMQAGILGEWTKGLILNRTVFDQYIDEYRRKLYATVVRWHARNLNDRWQPIELYVQSIISNYVARPLDVPHKSGGYIRRVFCNYVQRQLN